MNTSPRVSVVVPYCGKEKNTERTIDSLLGQSLAEIEILCVGYSAADGAGASFRAAAEKDPRVRVIDAGAVSAAAALNRGLDNARGEYVHFLRAGDYVLDYAYEALYNKLVRYDLDCVKCCAVDFDEKLDTTVENEEHALDRLRVGDFNRLIVLDDNRTLLNLGMDEWTGLYRRSFLLENGLRFDDLPLFWERPFYYRLVLSGPRIAAARDRLIVHRVNASEISDNKTDEILRDSFAAVRLTEKALLEKDVDKGTLEFILKREFSRLLERCRQFCSSETYGDMVLSETERFLAEFDYRFLFSIRKTLSSIRREELARRETGGDLPAVAENQPISVFYEKCASPKVSVVVPIFNQEEYLNQALFSLTTQTLPDMEFICINDGSTDRSMAIYREYANVDKRFCLIDKENTGYGNSMNLGIDAARGEYLGILEPDDYVPAHMFKKLYDVASENKLDFVKADFNRFWINDNWGTRTKLFRLSAKDSYYNRVINPSQERDTFRFVMNTWSGIYKRSFLNRWHIRHNETPGASYQDNGFWFQTFCRAKRVWFVREALYMNRRDNPNSSMFSKGKFYAVTNEYKFIYDWLSREPGLLAKYEDIFYYRKLTNFFVTYHRLDTSLKRDYLHHICEEFRPAMNAGKLSEDFLGEANWKILQEILKDPDAYYDQIRVSVIIPAYNAEKYIAQCLDSILVRDEVHMEVICVDDGSTDGTLDILRRYEQEDSRVRVIAQENAGAGAARNNGMQYARGEYLAFLDADDFFDPEMLRRAYEKAFTEDSDVIVVGCDQYIESKRQYASAGSTIRMDLLPEEKPFAGADIQYDIFKAFVGWPWDKLFRTEFVRRNGLTFQEQRTTNDMLFVFSAIVKAERISVLREVLAHHRRLEAGASLSVSRELSWDCFYHALCAVRQQLRDWDLYERRERDFINYALHSCLWNVNSLKGPSYYRLYDKLKTEWFEELGILDKEPLYFYADAEYEQFQKIRTLDAEDYIFYRLKAADDRASAANTERGRVNDQLKTTRNELKKTKKKLNRSERRIRKIKKTLVGRAGVALYHGLKKLKKRLRR